MFVQCTLLLDSEGRSAYRLNIVILFLFGNFRFIYQSINAQCNRPLLLTKYVNAQDLLQALMYYDGKLKEAIEVIEKLGIISAVYLF